MFHERIREEEEEEQDPLMRGMAGFIYSAYMVFAYVL